MCHPGRGFRKAVPGQRQPPLGSPHRLAAEAKRLERLPSESLADLDQTQLRLP
jgi:hypothetical protein